MRKPVVWVSGQVRRKRGCTILDLKSRGIVESWHYLFCKNKSADHLNSIVAHQLISAFVFAYAKTGFLMTWLKSHGFALHHDSFPYCRYGTGTLTDVFLMIFDDN